MHDVKGITRAGISVLVSLLLIACGGGGGSSAAPTNNNDETPPVVTTPEQPTPIPEPEPEPVEVATTNPLPPAKNHTASPMSTLAITNVVTNSDHNGNLTVTWTSSANRYRVLFWPNDTDLYQGDEQNNSAQIPSHIRNAGGQLVIEAYDELGNSMFSAPTNVEAL